MGKDEKDCAIEILKTAKTAWQKNVGEVLVKLESDCKWLKWLITGTFSVSVLGLVALILKLGAG